MGVALRLPLMANRRVNLAALSGSPLTRRVIALVLAGVLVAGLALSWEAFSDPRFMPVEVVRVQGDLQHVSREGLERQIAPLARDGFFTVDLDRIRAAAMSDPWVEEVSIRRTWPRGLLIRIHEREPFARWSEHELITTGGEVFDAAGIEQPRLPLLHGPRGRGREMIEAYLSFEQQLNRIGLRVAELVQDERGSWRIRTADGMQLRLGRAPMGERLERFVDYFPRIPSEGSGRLEQIDLRYTNGFALAWRGDDAARPVSGGD
jgi:cell division protein FtsQ